MNSGTTFEEIKRLFDYLEENKTNNDLQIILTTEGCHDLYKLFIDCNQYQKILEERINKAIEYIEEINEERKGLSVSEFMGKWRDILKYYESGAIINDLLKILKAEEK